MYGEAETVFHLGMDEEEFEAEIQYIAEVNTRISRREIKYIKVVLENLPPCF